MTSPAVRPATPADIPVIAAIYRHAVLHGTASFELEPPDEAEVLRRYEAVVGGGYPYFVAEIDGKVVGYAYANAYRPRPGYRFTVEDSVYIRPDAQGKGIGRALLNALIEASTKAGFRLMVAVIGDLASTAMPTVTSPGSHPTMFVNRRGPSSSSTIATTSGTWAANAGCGGRCATV
jgi:phosphinothricin acetyltransferase